MNCSFYICGNINYSFYNFRRNSTNKFRNYGHFLKKDETGKLEQKIENAMPYLFLVSINGADDGDTHQMGWDRLIQPLGRGDYDVLKVLWLLKERGYHYPFSKQVLERTRSRRL